VPPPSPSIARSRFVASSGITSAPSTSPERTFAIASSRLCTVTGSIESNSRPA
jgi:hypothetical protein